MGLEGKEIHETELIRLLFQKENKKKMYVRQHIHAPILSTHMLIFIVFVTYARQLKEGLKNTHWWLYLSVLLPTYLRAIFKIKVHVI